MADDRPLTTEPLALDLVNTEWIAGGERRDLLASEDGMRAWLRSAGFDGAPVDGDALRALLQARAAIRSAAERRDDAEARAALNDVLDHGSLRERLGAAGVERAVDVDHERWHVPWLAARNFLDLVSRSPDRIRSCAGHQCVLHFYDTSRAGRRQWCSMAACGNRAKARRHYEKLRGSRPSSQ